MTRRSDQLTRIEQAIARLEEAVAEHAGALRGQAAAIRIEVRDAASSAEAAHAGVQALADIHATGPADPAPKTPQARRRTAAGTFAPESGEAAERLHQPGADGE
jgi:hypothetical protein